MLPDPCLHRFDRRRARDMLQATRCKRHRGRNSFDRLEGLIEIQQEGEGSIKHTWAGPYGSNPSCCFVALVPHYLSAISHHMVWYRQNLGPWLHHTDPLLDTHPPAFLSQRSNNHTPQQQEARIRQSSTQPGAVVVLVATGAAFDRPATALELVNWSQPTLIVVVVWYVRECGRMGGGGRPINLWICQRVVS